MRRFLICVAIAMLFWLLFLGALDFLVALSDPSMTYGVRAPATRA